MKRPTLHVKWGVFVIMKEYYFENLDDTITDLTFNPRTHKECDHDHSAVCKARLISIHALTRSAIIMLEDAISLVEFQSTHSQGVRW